MSTQSLEQILEAILVRERRGMPGSPEAIVAQEKRGQAELVSASALPVQMGEGDRELLESRGIVFGTPVDALFLTATLPTGWSKRATDHDMWSELLDVDGKVVANIFYKASAHDRRAFLSVA